MLPLRLCPVSILLGWQGAFLTLGTLEHFRHFITLPEPKARAIFYRRKTKMKKLLIVLIIAAGFFPILIMAQDADTLKAALPDGFSIISVDQEATPLSAKVRGTDGKVSTVYLIKSQSGEWTASSNPDYYRPPGDVFVQSEQQDESQIKKNETRMKRRYEEEQRDQDIADDIEDDR